MRLLPAKASQTGKTQEAHPTEVEAPISFYWRRAAHALDAHVRGHGSRTGGGARTGGSSVLSQNRYSERCGDHRCPRESNQAFHYQKSLLNYELSKPMAKPSSAVVSAT
jgi:hypothetical protein